MNYKEALIEKNVPLQEIDEYLAHLERLNMKLNGDLLVIGVESDLFDLVAVEPHVNKIRSILMIDYFPDSKRFEFLEIFRQKHQNIPVDIKAPLDIVDASGSFDSITWFGAGDYFFALNYYRKIAELLKPGGNFYGTCNYTPTSIKNTVNLDKDTKMTTIWPIKTHPRFPDYNSYCGIIIEKALH